VFKNEYFVALSPKDFREAREIEVPKLLALMGWQLVRRDETTASAQTQRQSLSCLCCGRSVPLQYFALQSDPIQSSYAEARTTS
jgi:hypothetical protein